MHTVGRFNKTHPIDEKEQKTTDMTENKEDKRRRRESYSESHTHTHTHTKA